MSDVKHIPSMEDIRFEAVTALDHLIKVFLYFCPRGISEKDRERLLASANSQAEHFEDMPDIVRRVSLVMKDLYYDMTGDVSDLADIRRKIEEIGSILHIGRSYPVDALRRMKKIKSLYVERMTNKKRTENRDV